MTVTSVSELVADLRTLGLSRGLTPCLPDGARPPGGMLDRWARAAALADPEVRHAAIWAIREAARANGVMPASIQDLYAARGRVGWGGRTVPALNLRGWTYQTSRAAFRAARKLGADLLIFEQALAEMVYADQRPAEYTAAVLAAALREGHRGPIFLQGDHVQVNAAAYARDPEAEVRRLTDLMREELAASFYNIDVDASTIVDLSLPSLVEQQRLNAELTARFTRAIRELEPGGVTISVGAEIGEVGAHNTTPDELRAFMATYPAALAGRGGGAGISKVSVNSGTTHGGVVLPDGSLAEVRVDFDTLSAISRVAREEFGLSGAVQHGARSYVFTHHAGERKPGQTDAQFVYTTRKKAWPLMKQRFWDLPSEIQEQIGASLEEMFGQMFERLNVGDTRELVARFTKATPVAVPVPPALAAALQP
ncbi:MAG: class II fructose-bisphosphate aldolase [candidate division NC10 bacterium]|nr:class II fructose-bisphosphate aldolase [candidate division NC10 bacterium]